MVSVPFPEACEFARAADLVAVPARPTLVCPLFGEIFLLLAGEEALEVFGAFLHVCCLRSPPRCCATDLQPQGQHKKAITTHNSETSFYFKAMDMLTIKGDMARRPKNIHASELA